MKKIILTEEVEKALLFLYHAAQDFLGYPNVASHLETIKASITIEEEKKDAAKMKKFELVVSSS